jgi:hypothetical protein
VFVLVPLGSDQSVRRYPWFTIGVIVICLLVQIHEQMVQPPRAELEAATEQLLSATSEVMERASQEPDRAAWMRDFERATSAPTTSRCTPTSRPRSTGCTRSPTRRTSRSGPTTPATAR